MSSLVNVMDTKGASISYVDSTIELGYFKATSVTNLYSLSPNLNTNHGIATASNQALIITNPGVYTINLSLALTSGGHGGDGNTIFYNFGTQALNNVALDSIEGSFGGLGTTTQLYNYGATNTSSPGIINWTTTNYSTGNGANGNYDDFAIHNNQLVAVIYSKVNNSGGVYTGICTTQLTFTVNKASQSIYLNVQCGNQITLGNSYFTLQMISSKTF